MHELHKNVGITNWKIYDLCDFLWYEARQCKAEQVPCEAGTAVAAATWSTTTYIHSVCLLRVSLVLFLPFLSRFCCSWSCMRKLWGTKSIFNSLMNSQRIEMPTRRLVYCTCENAVMAVCFHSVSHELARGHTLFILDESCICCSWAWLI